jgi:hypothetical protein
MPPLVVLLQYEESIDQYVCNTASALQKYINTSAAPSVSMKDVITLRGDRELWLEVIYRAKKERKTVWEVLSPFLKKYTLSNEENRVLLILFPRDLVDRLLNQDDPDMFIEEALRALLFKKK